MLDPELIVTEAGGAGVGDDRGGDQRKQRPGQQPEIGNVKQPTLWEPPFKPDPPVNRPYP